MKLFDVVYFCAFFVLVPLPLAILILRSLPKDTDISKISGWYLTHIILIAIALLYLPFHLLKLHFGWGT
ncbi:hypothetical protein GGR20_001266 [Devosia subaequoris]|uniref:Uncharacterized protein n=1 Tax=Devosia subaequoris TaxID=395930 RepID=A0A7W6IL43_9HYPH|nr:hypothetical protein [Devosia subaequoris]